MGSRLVWRSTVVTGILAWACGALVLAAVLADDFANPEFTLEYLTGETFTPERLVELGLALPPLFAPGTGWSYSNTNTVLLGMVIQRVTSAG